ncbi:MAG TPA: chemotaxis protein CheD [Bryobacteraceae bacterium]|nr:chemotaxis protein CheD [Bryobacteraceae bacterium]
MTLAQDGTEIVVGMGDCRVAGLPALTLSTYALGSCIAVVVYDWKSKLGGLLHVMLPDSSMDRARAGLNPYVYVDTGVPALFRRLRELGSSKGGARCCIAGGASMMADSAHFEIGKRNYLALKKSLWKMGVFVDQEDVGGSESRSVRLDLETGRVDLRKGTGEGRILAPAGIGLTGRSASNASFARR